MGQLRKCGGTKVNMCLILTVQAVPDELSRWKVWSRHGRTDPEDVIGAALPRELGGRPRTTCIGFADKMEIGYVQG
jgi:hypothetical protein